MIENVILVFALIGIGTFSKRLGLLPENSAFVLNSFVLNISLPSMILISIPKLPLDGNLLYPVISHWLFYSLSIICILGFLKIFKLAKSHVGVLLVVACMGNTAFLGIPMVETFYGAELVPYAVLYDQLGSGIAFILTASFILPVFKDTAVKKQFSDILRDLIVFPPFVSLVLGFIFIFIPMPKLANNVLEIISKTLIPCAMISVGYQMKYRLNQDKLKPVVIGLVMKLVLIPLIGLVFVKLFKIENSAMNISLLQSGMPPMITAAALAMNADLESDIAASLVGYGLFFSFLTLPLIQFLLHI